MRQSASFTPYSSTLGAMSIGVKQYNAAFQSPWPLPDPASLRKSRSVPFERGTWYWSLRTKGLNVGG